MNRRVRLTARLGRTLTLDPLVFHVLKLPYWLEAVCNCDETAMLVEAAGARVPGEGEEPQAAGGLGLRQADEPRTYALADVIHADVELCDGLGVGREEANDGPGQLHNTHPVNGHDLAVEILDLLVQRVRIRDANPVLKACTPHPDKRLGVVWLEVFDASLIHVAHVWRGLTVKVTGAPR
jgi:hypothetical protein